uniref:Uncharacterized protein n=1 Tax=Arundo donax TaxID=35708 RepID=A0A0A9ELU9_ARUDO
MSCQRTTRHFTTDSVHKTNISEHSYS